MKKGNGGEPIASVKPQRPQKDPTGRIVLQTPGSKAPPPIRRKHNVTSPKRNSDDRQIKNFFKAKPDSEPPSGKRSIEIDVDDLCKPASEFPSITIEFDDPVSEFPAPPAETEKKLEGFLPLIRSFSTVLKRIYPKADGKTLEFTEKRILLDSKEIGTVEKTAVGISLRIWMHNLGFTTDSLPASTIFGLFNIADFFYADAKSKANYVSLYADSVGKRNTIKICFHREKKPSSFLSAPLRAIRE